MHGEREVDRWHQAKMVQEISSEEEFNRLTGQKGKLVVVRASVDLLSQEEVDLVPYWR